MILLEHPTPRPRCCGCAFSRGSSANTDVLTQVKLELALRLAAPFYCHEVGLNEAGSPAVGDGAVLCRGWSDEMGRRFQAGAYPQTEEPSELQTLTFRALELICEFETSLRDGDDTACDTAISQLMDEPRAWLIIREIWDVVEARR